MASESDIINQLAHQDLMPLADEVQDFYMRNKIEPSVADHWNPVPERELASVKLSRNFDVCPSRAWEVTTRQGIWMVYTWKEPVEDEDEDVEDDQAYKYTYSGWDDEVWFYVGPK